MSDAIEELLGDFRGNGYVSSDDLNLLEANLGMRLPDDYREFIERNNGGEGFIGKQYLIIWRANEVSPFNRDYQVNEYAPGIVLFASSGGGEGFGFDVRSPELSVVQVPFVGLDLRHAKKVANSFTDLLLRMHTSNGSLF